MSQIITLKIDVTKFLKDAFYKGQQGTYATVTVFLNDEKDKYGNFGMVTQDLGQERREAGEKGPILGNVTRVTQQQKRQSGQQQSPQQRQSAPAKQPNSEVPNFKANHDDIEF
jgi:transcription initiation factor TFIID subunit TAF12